MIFCSDLTRRHRTSTLVEGVTFEARPGAVTGLLGAPGAGRTTVLRLLLGLDRPTSGRALVLGRPFADLPHATARVGTLLDPTTLNPARSGRAVLLRRAEVVGVGAAEVDQLLDLAWISPDDAARRVRHYPPGLRQRLAVMRAVLGHPPVIVLDEPDLFLDAAGLRWLRALLADLAAAGHTVLITTARTDVAELLLDDLVVLERGRVVAHGLASSLLGRTGSVVTTPDPGRLRRVLTEAGYVVRAVEGQRVIVDADGEQIGWAAWVARVVITDLRPAAHADLSALLRALSPGGQSRAAIAAS